MRLLGNIHDANETFAKTNKQASDKIDAEIANAITNEVDGEHRVALLQYHTNLRLKRQTAERALEEKAKLATATAKDKVTTTKVDVSKAQLDAMNNRAGLTEAVDAKDNNPRQAQAFVKGLEKILARANPSDLPARNDGARVLLQAIKE